MFPKKKKTSKSSLILKAPKTEESYRKLYLTTPLVEEIQRRLDEIADNKAVFGSEYQDQGLLLCFADGSPIEPKSIGDAFKDAQRRLKIEDMLEFQGLRKSCQMHKVRLSNNNYQLVAEAAGQSPEVLMSNYNEAQDCEKRALSEKVEESFYSPTTTAQTAVHAKKNLRPKIFSQKYRKIRTSLSSYCAYCYPLQLANFDAERKSLADFLANFRVFDALSEMHKTP